MKELKNKHILFFTLGVTLVTFGYTQRWKHKNSRVGETGINTLIIKNPKLTFDWLILGPMGCDFISFFTFFFFSLLICFFFIVFVCNNLKKFFSNVFTSIYVINFHYNKFLSNLVIFKLIRNIKIFYAIFFQIFKTNFYLCKNYFRKLFIIRHDFSKENNIFQKSEEIYIQDNYKLRD